MAHEVHTAVDGGLAPVSLASFEGPDDQVVRAAVIVAVGLSTVLGTGTTRLALACGAHVDVPKPWVLEHKPKAGDFYVLTGPNAATTIEAEVFEAGYHQIENAQVDTADPAGAGDNAASGEGEQAAAPVDYLAQVDHPHFVEWFSVEQNAEAFGKKMQALWRKVFLHDESDAPIGGVQASGASAPSGAPTGADLDKAAEDKQAAENTSAGAAEGTGDAPSAEKPPAE